MSEWKERSVKRRDFRAVKDKPEAPGALRSKKTKRPIEIWRRYKPDYYAKHMADPELQWHIIRKNREVGNSWVCHKRCINLRAAEQSVYRMEHDPYWDKCYEYKIMKVGG